MEICTSLIFFLIGIIFGSFFMVVGIRLPQKISFTRGRSRCPSCSFQLAWYDNIPILSYIFLKGRCRKCRYKIPCLYPLTEAFTGSLFVICYLHAASSMELLLSLIFMSLLIIIIVTDLCYMLIPNKLLAFFLPAFILFRIIEPLDPWWNSVAGGLAGFLIIFIVILWNKQGMGAGDMKLMALLGIILGPSHMIATFLLACISGALIGSILLYSGFIQRNNPFPFGPFIAFGAILTYFLGEDMIQWYLNLFTT
ncbi:prepilin peptidase [Oceanobacillus sojae]|uniref:prepilin peptidase n=1 Tax=Oceanobacillus sojae TaxID=582851 RepID=UPI0009884107|nr:A24 family peptidase [Oceanobacillus sojae]MCT1902851.1 prepilin peptidase [Oceanobacillus sojae]